MDSTTKETLPVSTNTTEARNDSVTTLENVQWGDICEDEEGKASGVLNSKWSALSKKLRTICTRLSIKGMKNVRKAQMIECLIQSYHNRKAYDTLQNWDRGNQG
jgi:hypothetical protein